MFAWIFSTVIFSLSFNKATSIECVVCSSDNSPQSGCKEESSVITNCSDSSPGCYSDIVQLAVGLFRVEKRCASAKEKEGDKCFLHEITLGNGESVNGTKCYCTASLCNTGKIENMPDANPPSDTKSSTRSDVNKFSLGLFFLILCIFQ